MTARAENEPIRVLLIDDDPEDYLITKGLLEDLPDRPFVCDWVDGYDAGLAAIAGASHDVYLLDYRLGSRDGLQLLAEARAKNHSAAVILLTGQGEYEIDRKAIEAGAADYLEKGRLDPILLERSLRHALLQKHYEAKLEAKVAERTQELERLNHSLTEEILERKKAVEALWDGDRRKDEFLAVLAHELRNPLSPVRNALTIMRLKLDSREVVERAIGMIDRQVAHMVRLIDELMDVSRLTRNKLRLTTAPVRLSEVLAAAIELSQPQIEKAGLELRIEPPPEDVVLTADRLRLAQVFSNLLHNAAKYTPASGTVTISTQVRDHEAVVAVRDTGVGIPADQMPRLFELFTQIDRTLKRSQSGLGIGLALAHRLVKMHSGILEASSAGLGHGATFTVRLPLDID